jgi:hypothetical protein
LISVVRQLVPSLSAAFTCSISDAIALRAALAAGHAAATAAAAKSRNSHDGDAAVGSTGEMLSPFFGGVGGPPTGGAPFGLGFSRDNGGGVSTFAIAAAEDRVAIVEGQLRQLQQKFDRRDAEADRLQADVAEARGRLLAVEAQARRQLESNAARREESRKQLLLEESKVEKLTRNNRTLEAELEKLKLRLHQALGKK